MSSRPTASHLRRARRTRGACTPSGSAAYASRMWRAMKDWLPPLALYALGAIPLALVIALMAR